MKKSQAGLVEGDLEGASFCPIPARDPYPGTIGPTAWTARGLVSQFLQGWPGEEGRALVSVPPPSGCVTLVKNLYLNFSFVK